jgi:ceramide glucosyltransferase
MGALPWKIAAPMLLACLRVLTVISTLVCLGSIAYCCMCIWLGFRFAAESTRVASDAAHPPVSTLKPIKGADPEMYDALRSHCLLDYPDYEILFGITDMGDAAVPLIERLMQEFPQRAIRMVRCDQRLGPNGKVSSLAQLAKSATSEFLVVSDSDIQVASDYLRRIIDELQQPAVGLVTCLYRGIPARTLGSKFEALGISTDFVPGVLAARFIERGLHFGLGSTLAFRKRDLDAIGGFEAIIDYLGDDYEIGRRIAERGLRVELSGCVVETHLPAYDFAGFLSHQLRWARTIRASRPLGYAGLLFTFTLPWAAVALLVARGAVWAWWLFAGAIVARGVMAFVTARLVLDDTRTIRSLLLVPMRDFLAVVIWFGGLFGRKIKWRGESFTLEKGKLKPS